MATCNGCGGIVGRDCFNPQECEWISRDMEMRHHAEQAAARIEYESVGKLEYQLGQAQEEIARLTAELAERAASTPASPNSPEIEGIGAASPAPVAAITDERERFEKWVTRDMGPIATKRAKERHPSEPEEYCDRIMQGRWEDWQEAARGAAPQAQAAQQPVAWIRFRSDGGYEGPIMDAAMEDVRKKSGAWTPLYAAPVVAAAPALLNADELAALRRFNETCEDNEEYDVPKEMMRRLAALGAVEWKGFSRYQFTDFGMHVLGLATPAAPVAPSEQADTLKLIDKHIARYEGIPGDYESAGAYNALKELREEMAPAANPEPSGDLGAAHDAEGGV